MITLNDLLETTGSFSWAWNHKFFIETSYGNYVWSNPDYHSGDNTIRRFNGGLKQFLEQEHIEFVRDKGKHKVKDYLKRTPIQVGNL